MGLSSAFLLNPELCTGVVGLDTGFVVLRFVCTALAFVGLLGIAAGCGGALPSPMEPTILPRKLMVAIAL